MDVNVGVERVQFALMKVEVRGSEVAEIDCAGAMASELMGRGTADTDGRICACGEV